MLCLPPKVVCSVSTLAHRVLKQLQQMHKIDRLVVHKVLLKPSLHHVELLAVCRRPLPSHSRPLASSATQVIVVGLPLFCAIVAGLPLFCAIVVGLPLFSITRSSVYILYKLFIVGYIQTVLC